MQIPGPVPPLDQWCWIVGLSLALTIVVVVLFGWFKWKFAPEEDIGRGFFSRSSLLLFEITSVVEAVSLMSINFSPPIKWHPPAESVRDGFLAILLGLDEIGVRKFDYVWIMVALCVFTVAGLSLLVAIVYVATRIVVLVLAVLLLVPVHLCLLGVDVALIPFQLIWCLPIFGDDGEYKHPSLALHLLPGRESLPRPGLLKRPLPCNRSFYAKCTTPVFGCLANFGNSSKLVNFVVAILQQAVSVGTTRLLLTIFKCSGGMLIESPSMVCLDKTHGVLMAVGAATFLLNIAMTVGRAISSSKESTFFAFSLVIVRTLVVLAETYLPHVTSSADLAILVSVAAGVMYLMICCLRQCPSPVHRLTAYRFLGLFLPLMTAVVGLVCRDMPPDQSTAVTRAWCGVVVISAAFLVGLGAHCLVVYRDLGQIARKAREGIADRDFCSDAACCGRGNLDNPCPGGFSGCFWMMHWWWFSIITYDLRRIANKEENNWSGERTNVDSSPRAADRTNVRSRSTRISALP